MMLPRVTSKNAHRMSVEATVDFLAAVQEAMDARGLKHKDLAVKMGCARISVSQLMRGGRNDQLTFRSAARLADALGMKFKVSLEP